MKLDPDARDFLERYREVAPRPLHELGVPACRSMRMAGASPAAPRMSSVEDLTVPRFHHGEPGWLTSVWGTCSDGAQPPVPVRVFRPSLQQDLPVLVYLHGGGWSIGSVDGIDSLCRVLADLSEAVVVAVDYRQAPENPYPAPLLDCWQVLRWVAEGGLVDVDGSRLAVGGDSAGGNLAAVCSLIARDTGLVDLAAQLLVYAPTDAADRSDSMVSCAEAPVLTAQDVEWFWGLYLAMGVDPSHVTVSPKNADTLAGLPPTAVITAQYDPVRDDAEDFGRRLAASGVRVHQHRLDGVYHGFFPLVGVVGAADRAVEDAAAWLRGALQVGPARAGAVSA